jgi:hypothetical protein
MSDETQHSAGEITQLACRVGATIAWELGAERSDGPWLEDKSDRCHELRATRSTCSTRLDDRLSG